MDVTIQSGVCRYCACTDRCACILPAAFGMTAIHVCWWVDRQHTICSNPDCLLQAKRDGVLPRLTARAS